MNLQYLKILLIGLALVFLSQGCLPPPPPYHYDRNDHHRHRRYRHGYSLQQLPNPVAQLIMQNGGEFSDPEEVVH